MPKKNTAAKSVEVVNIDAQYERLEKALEDPNLDPALKEQASIAITIRNLTKSAEFEQLAKGVQLLESVATNPANKGDQLRSIFGKAPEKLAPTGKFEKEPEPHITAEIVAIKAELAKSSLDFSERQRLGERLTYLQLRVLAERDRP